MHEHTCLFFDTAICSSKGWKTKEILYFLGKKALLFNHTLTKSLQDGTSNVFALKRHVDVCPVTAFEVYISLCDLLKISIR